MSCPLRALANIRLHTSDLPAAKRWYTDFLGVAPYFERPGYLEFRIGDEETELGILDVAYLGALGAHGAATDLPRGPVAYWHVDSVETAIDRAVSFGAAVHEARRDFGGGFVVASVRDPFGNVLGLMFSPHYRRLNAQKKSSRRAVPPER